jgi:putative ABC transport system ATP-binding protein
VSATLVCCRGVSVLYGSVTALADANLEVQPQERVALVGRSGSGKTTLLHVLGGLVAPSAGTVEWKEQPLAALDAAARASVRRHSLAYIFQGANLLPYFSAAENVAFAAHLAEAAASPLELLGLVGLAGKADHLPAELSGGEQQRVAIARALAQRPQLLLCDEPTGHLDSDTAERVLDLLDAVQTELELAIVVATHDTAVASRFDRVVELADGRVRSETVLA